MIRHRHTLLAVVLSHKLRRWHSPRIKIDQQLLLRILRHAPLGVVRNRFVYIRDRTLGAVRLEIIEYVPLKLAI